MTRGILEIEHYFSTSSKANRLIGIKSGQTNAQWANVINMMHIIRLNFF